MTDQIPHELSELRTAITVIALMFFLLLAYAGYCVDQQLRRIAAALEKFNRTIDGEREL